MTETVRYTEDELASAVTSTVGDDSTEWKPEVHYNHYGDRGVVDLLQIQTYDECDHLRVYELKCQSAIESVTGANEILRQFNRHRTYFFRGSSYDASDYSSITFELTFAATQPCYQHVRNNWHQYKHIARDLSDKVSTQLLFRSPDAEYPFIPQEDAKIVKTVELENTSGFNPEVSE